MKRMLLILTMFLFLSGSVFAAVNSVFNANVAIPVAAPTAACTTQAYASISTVALPATINLLRDVELFQGAGVSDGVLIRSDNVTNQVVLTEFTLNNLTLGTSLQLSTADDPINENRFIHLLLDDTGGAQDGRTFVFYHVLSAVSGCSSSSCLGIMRLTGTTLNDTRIRSSSITNINGIAQDSTTVYISIDNLASARQILRFDKTSLNLGTTITVDAGNNSGGLGINPVIDTINNLLFVDITRTGRLARIDLSNDSIITSPATLVSGIDLIAALALGDDLLSVYATTVRGGADDIRELRASDLVALNTITFANASTINQRNNLVTDVACNSLHLNAPGGVPNLVLTRVDIDGTFALANTFIDPNAPGIFIAGNEFTTRLIVHDSGATPNELLELRTVTDPITNP